MDLSIHNILKSLSKPYINNGPTRRQTSVPVDSCISKNTELDGIKTRLEVALDDAKYSYEHVIYHLLKDDKQSLLDNHTFGIYNSICDKNFYILEEKVFFLDFNRFEQKLKACKLPTELKNRYRILSLKRDGASLHFLNRDVFFGTCFRFLIGNKFVTHLKSFKSLHALKMAFAITTTGKLFNYNLSTSRQFSPNKIRQVEDSVLSVLFLYLLKKINKCKTEKEIIKLIKLSYCTEFSLQSQQECPSGFEKSFRLFPSSLCVKTKEGKMLNWEQNLKFYFSILQSKSLCHEVSPDFIQDSLEEHRKTLCTGLTIELDEKYRQEFVRQGKELGKYLQNHYNPYITRKAPSSASYNFSREKGGCLGELYSKDMVLINNHLSPSPENRMEPIVIGLFGPPGTGKTTLVQELITKIHRRFFKHLSLFSSFYSRSCASEFWDGYQNQPIVIVDDFGQSSDRKDVIEFQQLVSVNQYHLPMASLEDKGRCFTSPFIILTSNMDFGSGLHTSEKLEPVEDNLAFWRRIHLAFHLGNRNSSDHVFMTDRLATILPKGQHFGIPPHHQDRTALVNALFIQSNGLYPKVDHTYDDFGTTKGNFCASSKNRKSYFPVIVDSRPCGRTEIFELSSSMYISSLDYHNEVLSKTWKQTVFADSLYKKKSSKNETFEKVSSHGLTPGFENYFIEELPEEIKIEYEFNPYPPEAPLRVRAEAISEPLKCRIITAGDCSTWCLKPLQIAMWEYLNTKPQFVLTHGTQHLEKGVLKCAQLDFTDQFLEKKLSQINSTSTDINDVWVSGDYKSATDNFRLECGSIILQEAFKYIDHEPTKRWAMKELSSHIIDYPMTSGLDPGIQRNGQLMGSLLSFPLLCLVNDSTAYLAGARPDSYLINGDDILIKCNRTIYNNWKDIAPQLGLTLSIGKTFVSNLFGTVNSQLFIEGRQVTTGKQKLSTRRQKILGECYRDLYRHYGDTNPEGLKKLFLTLNRPHLTNTYESLDIPVHLGGLGLVLSSNYIYQSRDLHVYLTKILRKLKPSKGVYKFPYLSIDNSPDSIDPLSTLTMPETSDPIEGVQGSDIYRSTKWVEQNPALRQLSHSLHRGEMKLEDLPALGIIQIKEVFTESYDKNLQKSINNRFFNFCHPDLISSPEFKQLNKNFNHMLYNQETKALGLIRELIPITYPSTLTEEPSLCEIVMDPRLLWDEMLSGSCEFINSLSEMEIPTVERYSRVLREVFDCDISPIEFSCSDKVHEHMEKVNVERILSELVNTSFELPERD